MWFGTKVGLNRFDGKNFKDFNNTILAGANIYSLYEDRDHVLWIGTDRGLFVYNALKEDFYKLPESANIRIRNIQQDKDGNIWYIKGSSISCINKGKKEIFSYQKPNGELITAICMTSDNTIWISTSGGQLEKFDARNKRFSPFNVFAHSPKAKSVWIENIYDAGNGKVFIGTANQGVKLFNTITNTYADVLTYDPGHNEIFARNFVHVDKDNFWIATESGIFQYNIATGEHHQLIKQYNDPYSLSDNAVYALCKDKEGGIWAGTYFGGVNYHPGRYMWFEKYFPQDGLNTLKGNAVREICPDGKGNVWIGTEDAGLHKMEISSGKITKVQSPEGKDLSNTNIHGLLVNGNQLWIGTFQQGLDIMDIKNSRIIKSYTNSAEPGQLHNNFIASLYLTRNGTILIGTSRGLYRYNKTTDNFSIIDKIPLVHIKDILEDNTGQLWLSSLADGLFTYNLAMNVARQYIHNENNSSSLPSNMVNSVFQSSDSQIWITTEGGISRYTSPGNFENLTTANGLNSNVTYRILEDAQHQLWITTANGLVLFDPRSGHIKNYFKSNGLLSNQFNYNSSYKDSSGKMYFGCVKGMISFNPDNFDTNKFMPPVYITGFQINNKEIEISDNGILQSSLLYNNQIELAYNQSSFSIDFAALSYTSPELLEYSYIMEGLNKDWTYLKTNRKVYFTGLGPGKYVFKLKATNSSGIWTSRETVLTINILPPVWATRWAYLLYILLAALAVFLIVRNYHLRVNEKNRLKIEKLYNEKEKETYRAKMEFFTNVAHEIKTPLALIKGPLEEIIKAGNHNSLINLHLGIMDRNAKRLADLTSQLLDFRNVESSGFRLSFLEADITTIVNEHYLNFKPMAESHGITFTIDAPATPLLAFIDLDAFSKIVNNLFDNAIKYAESSVHIQLVLHNSEDFFVLRVENDGYLVPNESKEIIFEPLVRLKTGGKQAGSGIGLALARSLAELHKGTLTMDTNITDKNIFVLHLPVHHHFGEGMQAQT
jgi:ligand-binding sensor domain-containing protein/signal transduction histidine kinase